MFQNIGAIVGGRHRRCINVFRVNVGILKSVTAAWLEEMFDSLPLWMVACLVLTVDSQPASVRVVSVSLESACAKVEAPGASISVLESVQVLLGNSYVAVKSLHINWVDHNAFIQVVCLA